MELWSPELRLTIFLTSVFLLASFIFVITMLYSLGTMDNLLSHLQEISRAESEIRLNLYIGMLKQHRMRLQNVLEHERRQEALLAIPLVRNKGKS